MDRVLAQPLGREIGLDVGRKTVLVLVDVERLDLIDRLPDRGHSLLQSYAARLARMRV